MENPKPKKSIFVHQVISNLNNKEKRYCKKLQRLLAHKSEIETIGYISNYLSSDNKQRPLVLSREIVKKIEFDHGSICPENMIINIHEWEYFIKNVDNKPGRINLIKMIPNSDNYLVIAASQDNGFYIVTHFETESKNGNNLKRLLKRGNVISRVSSVASTTNQDFDSSQSREVF